MNDVSDFTFSSAIHGSHVYRDMWNSCIGSNFRLKPCLHCTQNLSGSNPDRIMIVSTRIGCGYIRSVHTAKIILNACVVLSQVLLHERGRSHDRVTMARLSHPQNQRGSVTLSPAFPEHWPSSAHYIRYAPKKPSRAWSVSHLTV